MKEPTGVLGTQVVRQHPGSRGSVFVKVSALVLILGGSFVTTRLGSLQWYALSCVLLTVVVLSDRSLERQALSSYRVIGALSLAGLFGAVYGRFLEEQNANSLALFFPLVVVVADSFATRSLDTSGMLRVFKWCAYAYCVSAVVVLVLGMQLAPEYLYRHQSSYFLFLGIVVATLDRDYLLLTVALITSIICVFNYPALTFVYLACIVIAVTITHFVNRKRMRNLFAIYAASGLVIYLLRDHIQRLGSLYYEVTGKGDNTRTREILYDVGISRLWESPYWGSFFAGDISIDSPLGITGSTLRVPLHNDYLQLAVGGGMIWVACFVISLVFFLGRGLLATSQLDRSDPRRITMTAAVATSTSILAAAVYNPMLIVTQNALILAVLLVVVANLQSKPLVESSDSASRRLLRGKAKW